MDKLSDNFIKYFMPKNSNDIDIELEIAMLHGIRKLEDENFKLSAGQCVVGDGIISGEFGHALCPLIIKKNIMDKEQAIKWCRSLKNLPSWPRTTKFSKVPEGWKWVISHKPYCNAEILLEHTGHDEIISKDDIK